MHEARFETRQVERLVIDVSHTVWGQANALSLSGRLFMLALATEAVATRLRRSDLQVHDAALADSIVLTGGGRRISFSRLDGGAQILIRGDGFPTTTVPVPLETTIEAPTNLRDCEDAAREHIDKAVRALFMKL